MKLRNQFLVLSLVVFMGFSVHGQHKIGYANIDYILALMPETQSMRTELEKYQSALEKQLQNKKNYYQQMLTELNQWVEQQNITSEGDARLTQKAEELGLQKLADDLQKASADAEQKLVKKQIDLMSPITEKLEVKIKEVANAKGYDFILNQMDSGGVSIVLYGPEDRNLTKAIMTALNIPIPPELQN